MSRLSTKKIRFGKNADPAKNFILEVPDAEDGTITLLREDGTQVAKFGLQGELLLPSQPSFRGTLGRYAPGTWTNVVPNIYARTDAGNVGITIANSNRLVAPITGRYFVEAWQLAAVNTNADYFYLRKNGIGQCHGYRQGSSPLQDIRVSGTVHLVAGEYVDFLHSSTTETWDGSHSSVSMFLIG